MLARTMSLMEMPTRLPVETFSRRFYALPARRSSCYGGQPGPQRKGVPMNAHHRLGHSRVWRYVRLAGALLALPLVLWACTSHPLEAPQPLPETQTDDFYAVNPIRDIDMLFVIDDSGSTSNKQNN